MKLRIFFSFLAALLAAGLLFFSFGCSRGVDSSSDPTPNVLACSPSNEASNVVINTAVSVSFSAPLLENTINQDNFSIAKGGVKVSGTYSYIPEERTIVFVPERNLAVLSQYDAAISSGLKSDRGVSASPFAWHFNTGNSAGIIPVVTARYPLPSQIVDSGAKIWVGFNLDMDSSTINSQSFTVYGPRGKVSGSITYEALNGYYSLTPAAALQMGATYVATVLASVASTMELQMRTPVTWIFHTQANSDPTIRLVSTIPSYTTEADLFISGEAQSNPETTIASVEYRLDYLGTWNSTNENISGQHFSGSRENFRINLLGLTDNTHTVEVRAVDGFGNRTGSPETNSFIVDAQPVRLISWHPNTAESGAVPTTETISFVFNKNVSNATSAFSLWSGGTQTPCTRTFANNILSVTPESSLNWGATYSVTIDSTVTDTAGRHLTPFYWTFVTSFEPINNLWTMATSSAGFGQLYGHSAGVYSSQLLVMGGSRNGALSNLTYAAAADGANWTVEGPPTTAFSPRVNQCGIITTSIVGTKATIVGGFTASGLTNDTWSNFNFGSVSWSTADAGGTAPDIFQSAIVDQVGSSYIYLVGGQIGTNYTNEVSVYNLDTDPLGWSNNVSFATEVFSPRAGHTVNWFNAQGNYFLIGGKVTPEGSPNYSNEIWKVDILPPVGPNHNWQQVIPSGTCFSPRAYQATVGHNNKLYVIGGLTANGPTNDVWSSGDGITWTNEQIPASFEARYMHTATSFNGQIYIVGGRRANGSGIPDVWKYNPH